MYLRHQAYTLYYRHVCILVFLHVFAYSMLLRCIFKFKRLACGSDDVTQYNTLDQTGGSQTFMNLGLLQRLWRIVALGLCNIKAKLPNEVSARGLQRTALWPPSVAEGPV